MSATSYLITVAKIIGGSLLSYALPRILIGAGLPLDIFAANAGKYLGANLSIEAATWAASLAIAIFLLLANFWLPPAFTSLAAKLNSEAAETSAGADDLVSIFDGGLWLYENGNLTTRTHLRAMVPEPFDSIGQHGAAFIVEAARAGVGQLYGRRDRGLSHEQISPDDADTTAINPVTGDGDRQGRPIDISIRRSDLRQVLQWYETS